MHAALALCDHSATGAVPPRGQVHRLVVILSGVPNIGPGGTPHASGEAEAVVINVRTLFATFSMCKWT
jgi:hypothetical protein